VIVEIVGFKPQEQVIDVPGSARKARESRGGEVNGGPGYQIKACIFLLSSSGPPTRLHAVAFKAERL
jgi:hypothetical protein